MTSEFGEIKEVIVTPEMLNRYFSMTKVEILVHLFLLSVCDSDRHIKRNVRALARETERWPADVYQALTRLSVKKMVEEKKLKMKGGRFWRVYPQPRTRKVNGSESSPPNSQANLDARHKPVLESFGKGTKSLGCLRTETPQDEVGGCSLPQDEVGGCFLHRQANRPFDDQIKQKENRSLCDIGYRGLLKQAIEKLKTAKRFCSHQLESLSTTFF